MLRVTLLADEWGSSKGGLSTLNRELAKQLAYIPGVKVSLLVPNCSEQEKAVALDHGVALIQAQERPGMDPVTCLSFPPKELHIDVVISCGQKLGPLARVIQQSRCCTWVHVVHTASEELAMFKRRPVAISEGEKKQETELQLCSTADLVVAIGPKVTEARSAYLRSYRKDVLDLTPGIFKEFCYLEQEAKDHRKFRVLVFGRGDSEDFELKGYDIAAQAVAMLEDPTYHLIFVGAPNGKEEEVKENLLKHSISRSQLTVRSFRESREKLADLFLETDLAIMPSRTEGFGLTALEALSAGVPILVSGNSGFGEALKEVPFGQHYTVDSDDAKVWAKQIKHVREKGGKVRLAESQALRTNYATRYGWQRQCKALVEKMQSITDHVKEGTPSDEELEILAVEIGDSWQFLGRRLKFSEAKLTAFHRENEKDWEKAYKMLLTWKRRNGPDASYRYLYEALRHRLVSRNVLAVKFCCDAAGTPANILPRGDKAQHAYYTSLEDAGIYVWPRRDKAQQPYDTALEDASDPLSKPKALLLEESLLKRDRKTNILRGKVKDEEDLWELTEAAGFIRFPPKAVTELMEITYSLWSPGACSPPLGENEALVSNVIELSCDGLSGLKLSGDFNEGVTLALSHSATDLEGYEVVIQQLMDSGNNEWKDLKTKNTWRASGIQGDPPLAEAKVTQCSSFAVIWRLKSFIFSSSPTSMTDPVFTCIVSEYPDVSVAIPRSDLPASGDFSLTIKVQEVPCDEVKDDGVLVGPILHISSSPEVQFLEPVTIKIPFVLGEARKEVQDLFSGHLRILFFNCGGKCPKWTEITEHLETSVDVKTGVVTFQVKHLSRVWVWYDWCKQTCANLLQCGSDLYRRCMRQEAGFLACLCKIGSPDRLLLALWCFPLHKQTEAQKHITSNYVVHRQGEGNSLKPLCKDDEAFISCLEALTPLEERDFKKFPLRFLGDHSCKSQDLLVRVGDKDVPIVKLNKVQAEDEVICELVLFPKVQAQSNVASTSQAQSNNISGCPPQLSFTLPGLSDLQPSLKPQNEVKLPIDALLLTVNDCEFSSCYVYLKDPFRSFYHGLGYVYFGTMGEGQVTAALLKCDSAGPGGILIDVKNAADVLRPKVAISVGTCGSLMREKAKLGDVVLAAKVTTYARKEVRNDRVVSCGVRTLCSRDTAHLIKHAAFGWKAPLENPKARKITVHSDSEVLSGPELVNSEWRKEELIEQHPTATAIEMEGEGVLSAAFDLKMEWLVVKGISNHADGRTTETAPWKEFASVMAASIVCHMLKDSVVLRDWPHYKGSIDSGVTGSA